MKSDLKTQDSRLLKSKVNQSRLKTVKLRLKANGSEAHSFLITTRQKKSRQVSRYEYIHLHKFEKDENFLQSIDCQLCKLYPANYWLTRLDSEGKLLHNCICAKCAFKWKPTRSNK